MAKKMAKKFNYATFERISVDTNCNGKSKKRYTTEREADNAIADRLIDNPSIDLKSYRCDKCKGWHITSQERDSNVYALLNNIR